MRGKVGSAFKLAAVVIAAAVFSCCYANNPILPALRCNFKNYLIFIAYFGFNFYGIFLIYF